MKVQYIAIGVAVVLAGISVMVLTGILPGMKSNQEARENLLMWGFHDPDIMQAFMGAAQDIEGASEIQYVLKDINTWESDFLNTLARGGDDIPDILVFPSDYLQKHKDKLSFAPIAILTENAIKQQFVESGDVFLSAKGDVFGIPFYADALVLYWNKDLFTQNLITLPPKTWNEFSEISNKITRKDSTGTVTVSGAALGRGINIKNTPLITSTLFLQGGDEIIDQTGRVVLGGDRQSGSVIVRPAEDALRFMSDFSNPRKTIQSWSPAFPEAREAFVSQKLGMYLGLMSEYKEIKDINPHLNFAVAPVPQLKDSPRTVTGGTLYALVVPKASPKQQSAWTFAKYFSNYANSSWYADESGGVSLRRDVLPQYQRESVRSAFAEAALTLKLWAVPDPKLAEQVFREVVEDVALERATFRDALNKVKARLK